MTGHHLLAGFDFREDHVGGADHAAPNPDWAHPVPDKRFGDEGAGALSNM